MKTYTVTEIENEDWEVLPNMSDNQALEILNQKDIEDYCGSYTWGSTNLYDYEKAKYFYAMSIAEKALGEKVHGKTM